MLTFYARIKKPLEFSILIKLKGTYRSIRITEYR